MEITVDQMYQIENNGHDMGFLKKFMMENAGSVAVRRLIEKIGNVDSKNILIFVGMGNNGGDGQVMARHLAGHNANVVVVLLGTPDKFKTEESSWNWSILEKMKKSVKLYKFGNEYPKQDLEIGFLLAGQVDKVDFGGNVAKPDVIIDAILGTGVQGRNVKGPYDSAIRYINKTDCFKFAVDVPSGMNPQTGETADFFTKCDMTVTFHKMKQGIPKRKDLTGELFAEKIGIPPEAEIDVL